MSLTSYQAAPPRVFTYADGDRESKLKKRSLVRSISRIQELAPAVGFEPTTNRLTADRSTTELRWIVSRLIEGVYLAHTVSNGKP
jgi:hypothetical protein